jgi:hypothetical protein
MAAIARPTPTESARVRAPRSILYPASKSNPQVGPGEGAHRRAP